ncbi:MAG: ArgE/DapE family deacylase [Candidatus Bathyarchaeota archaeon]|nr:ArgE/DapE family deacylase [Candidatus Bathyarchaeota archaeon]
MKLEQIIKLTENTDNEVAELCSGLVKFNSAHPDGFTDETVAYIKKYLDKHGIENEVHAKDPKKPNIVARIKGTTDKKIIWVGHLDVVPEGKPENWTYPPYSGEIADKCVWGRGSSDMKGSCAAAMVSARILNEMDSIPNTVEYWFTSDEEIGGGAGARWLAETGRFKGDICIIGDGNGGGPTAPSIDLGCKGGAGVKLIARGRTAHGSTPYLGDNAISKLIKAVPWVEKINDFKLDFPDDLKPAVEGSIEYYKTATPMTPEIDAAMEHNFYTPSVTCNIINGGVKINVVPDYAEAEFDIRITPGSHPLRVVNRIKELVKESGIDGLEITSRDHKPDDTAGYYESPNSSFADQFTDIIGKITGIPVNMKILTGGTDGISTSKRAGIPSLGYGTSLTGQAHQPDERVTVENLVLGVKIFTAFPLLYK